jgi:N-acetylneuraminic acid mutarotase
MSPFRRMTGVVFGIALILRLAIALSVQAQGPIVGKWEKGAPFPEPEEELFGAVANGKMYVEGGYGVEGHPVGMMWEYDPATDKWTKKKSMPIPAHHAAMTEYHGKLYIFGGFIYYPPVSQDIAGWQPIDSAWEYDPAADSWKAIAPMPTKRGSPAAVVSGDRIYVVGGASNQGTNAPALFPNGPARSLTTNEVYDPETNKWETRNPMPTPRNHSFAGAVNGKIYVMGGRAAQPFITVASNLDIVEEYDPSTDQWGPQKARMPTARSGGGFATYKSRIYAAGGEVQTPQMLGAFRALEAYDPATNTWAILPPMPLPRHGVATAFLGNRLHLVSGKITSGGYTPDVQVATTEHDVVEILDK